eukprot:m.1252273 g.1252273  ORF g.1252273 m.1252273 type:complete len:107 (+) comp24703_c0_seq57:5052-5372(+)
MPSSQGGTDAPTVQSSAAVAASAATAHACRLLCETCSSGMPAAAGGSFVRRPGASTCVHIHTCTTPSKGTSTGQFNHYLFWNPLTIPILCSGKKIGKTGVVEAVLQ